MSGATTSRSRPRSLAALRGWSVSVRAAVQPSCPAVCRGALCCAVLCVVVLPSSWRVRRLCLRFKARACRGSVECVYRIMPGNQLYHVAIRATTVCTLPVLQSTHLNEPSQLRFISDIRPGRGSRTSNTSMQYPQPRPSNMRRPSRSRLRGTRGAGRT